MKVAYLKNLQGYLWENGYKTGAYSTPLFPDVVPQLKAWNDNGIELAIYSSGSVFAQKLLFGHVKSAAHITGQKRERPDEENERDSGSTVGEPATKKRAVSSSREGPSESTREKVESSTSAPEPPAENGSLAAPADLRPSEEEDSGVEDLQFLISDWFDTTNAGPKTEGSSYKKIADALKVCPSVLL